MSKLIILDVESYIYKASYSCKVLKNIDEFVYQEVYDLRNGIDFINNTVKRLKNKLKAQEIVMVVGDGQDNFRKTLYPEYKGNRTQPKPLMYDLILDYILNKYEVVSLPSLEADDVARIIYEDNKSYNFSEKVIVSIDKDFYTVPEVNFLRDLKDDAVVEYINKETAEYNLMLQTIMGDATDGYYGIPLWGNAKARKWLNDKPRLWSDVLELYQANGLTGEDYTKNKYCAKLVGLKNYDLEKGQVKINAEV